MRIIRVLINPNSGLHAGLNFRQSSLLQDIQKHWDLEDRQITYQFSKSAEDGRRKAKQAIEDGVDTILVMGGDGMVNSIGSALVNTPVALGVIPTGSGNGFARHFEIPTHPAKAVEVLAHGRHMAIDVGTANGDPFFVTCSMAWDATIVRSFEKSPVRGVLPYVFAAWVELLEYQPQPYEITLDGSRKMLVKDPLVFTVANLTQFGGGARIAPQAKPDDGFLELVMVHRSDGPRVLPRIPRLFDGSIGKIPEVETQKFKSLLVHRKHPAPVQLDGELVEEVADVLVRVLPKALNVIVPR